ncbi:RNA-directed DNA polymerase protein [Dioscorea alata]|uniref:RNA-directed DNA polymerase protein n=1 Tax=Dioscorea alata TaxID=55571 RepID=A0ACB7WC31_DIOAL|nr:RNA-directed DNA polymerase protein [Dioscorea alata]
MEVIMDFEKLKEDNWSIWKIIMKDHLVYKELDLPLLRMDVKPSSMSDEKWKSLDQKLLLVIRMCISTSILFDQSFEQPSGINKMHAMKRLFLMKMKDGVMVWKHLNEFNSNQVKGKQVDGEASITSQSDDKVTLSIACMVSSSIDTWQANGKKHILTNVRHIPEITKNLISAVQLNKADYVVTFGNRSWKISKGCMTLLKGGTKAVTFTISLTHANNENFTN